MPFFQSSFSTGCFLLAAIRRLLKFFSVISKLFPEVIYNMPRDKSYKTAQESTENLNFVFHFFTYAVLIAGLEHAEHICTTPVRCPRCQ